eukprot:TRINITY_DN1010_c1_g1_i3.p1 TRINITY_DN1010_c1_g1~~TRINITY_DN1010_c1_g1_i3.p1  ORF type:complete len:918 (-),score=330.40 TRINITY_DN1010_c1_g1_i3:58-2811(-)
MFKKDKHDKEDKHSDDKEEKKKDKDKKKHEKDEEKREKRDKHASVVMESPKEKQDKQQQQQQPPPTSSSHPSLQINNPPPSPGGPSVSYISKTPSTPAVDQSQTDAAAAAAAAAAEQKKKEEERKKKDAAEDERKKKEMQEREAEEKAKRREERKRKEREDAEAQRLKDIAFSQQQIDDEGNEEAEAQSLEAVKPDSSDSLTMFRDVYDVFPPEVFTAYDNLQNYARDLNTQIPVLEVVLVGPKGCGKSSIIEAIIGKPSNHVGAGVTKRPLFLQFINNPEFTSDPKVTLKRDITIQEYDHDVDVSLASLPSSLSSRNTTYTDEPIFVHYEHASVLNMTIIDTPGLLLSPSSSSSSSSSKDISSDGAKIDEITRKIIKPTHRLILAVENASDWDSTSMPSWVKKVDPELSRTTFVYTKFYNYLQDVNNTRAVNRFLSGTLPDVKSFFTTMPSLKIRAKFNETEKFKQKIWQSYRRDMNYLEQLQYDKRFEKSIGVHSLRRWLLNQAWKNYQDSIPRILKHLRSKKTASVEQLRDVDLQIDSLNAGKLRGIASNYVVSFLQILEQLLQGTVEGQPTINGQTLDEEKQGHGDGDWYGANNRPIKFDPATWGVLYWDSKLYGGQQFERLLSEFKAVSDHTDITEVTMDDVATAAGVNKLNNLPNYAWAACDLAGQKSQEALAPLIDQLCDRAIYIMKRLTDVAEKIADSRKKKWQSSYRTGVNTSSSSSSHHHHHHHSVKTNDISNIEQYPYFTHHVKDLYFKFVDKTAEKCKKKCMSEFMETKTIHWDYTENPQTQVLPVDRASMSIEDTRSTVFNLTKTMFTSLRNRIVRNVLLKFYNFFLVPIQNDLWGDIQGKVNSLSDADLEQIFEISATKDKLQEDKKYLSSVVQKCAEQDSSLLAASTHFCHPIIMNQPGSSE